MKILTVCQGGNVHSVMARFILNYHIEPHQDCLAMGWEPNSEETKTMLYEWADCIVPMESDIFNKIPEQYRWKVGAVLDVGPDRWGLNSDLLNLVGNLAFSIDWARVEQTVRDKNPNAATRT